MPPTIYIIICNVNIRIICITINTYFIKLQYSSMFNAKHEILVV
jgi:hypothetical protein